MRFQCSNCMGIVSIDDSEAGHAVGCGHCGSIIMVPHSRTASGAIIDDFVIEKEVGQGGLATVYQAHQISLDRPAALKILREQYASNRTFIADFVKEARAAAQLNHPNIVQAYAVGEEDDIHFFAMEFVQGETLKHVLVHSGRLFPEKALEIIRVIAEALEFAWQKKKLIHLDIKPDNIILTEAREYKLADLGLARIAGDIRDNSDTTDVFGTPQYIAPEILTGSATDNRTDIYSLGATLYHAVTGQYPFQGQTASEIARKHITDRLVPARKVSSDIPQEVSDMIDIMMAKRPGHRWQGAAEIVREIDNILAKKPISRRPEDYYQKPLNLEKLEQELTMGLNDLPEGSEATSDGGKKISFRTGGTKLRGKSAGSSSVLRAKLKADKTSPRQKRGSKQQTSSASQKPDASALQTAPGTPDSDQSQTTRDTASRLPVKPKKKKKMSVSAMLGFLGVICLLMIVGAAIGIVVLKKGREKKEFAEKIARMELTLPQYEALMDFRRKLNSNQDDAILLENARELLGKYSGSKAMTYFVATDIQDVFEREVRGIREQRRVAEIKAWREQARVLAEKKQREEREAADRALKAEEQRKQQELAERLQQQKDAQVQALRKIMPDVRQEALQLCRDLDFERAKILFAKFKAAPSEELVAWAESKEKTIELAAAAFDLVRNSEDVLIGEMVSIKAHAQRVSITAIRTGGISAEYREKSYEQGQYVGEKVHNFNVDFQDIKLDQLVKLMDTSGRKQGLGAAEVNLKIGAFMLAVGAPEQITRERLNSANKPEITEPMLLELDAMN